MRFQRKGRSWASLIVVLAVWLGMLVAYLWLEAAVWIVVVVILMTLPAVWDFAMERNAGLEIDDTTIRWFSGRRVGELPRADLDHVRLSRRLDLTTRVSLVTTQNARVRLPQECVPPIKDFEQNLSDAQIRVERHPFSLV